MKRGTITHRHIGVVTIAGVIMVVSSFVFAWVSPGEVNIRGLWLLPLLTFLAVITVTFALSYFGLLQGERELKEKSSRLGEVEKEFQEFKETHTKQSLSARLETVGTLASGFAHEINNPLTVITAKADLLLARLNNTGNLDVDKAQSNITDIQQMAWRISDTVNQLQSYSTTTEEKKKVELQQVLGDSLSQIEERFAEKNVTLNKEYEDTPFVHAAPNQLKKTFANIIENSLDAMPEWGTITLGCGVQNGYATAYVKDTGTGIPQDTLERVFEPFFTTKEVGKGIGLGLYVCHKVVSEHSGEIELQSKIGEGTTIVVKLPLENHVGEGSSKISGSAS